MDANNKPHCRAFLPTDPSSLGILKSRAQRYLSSHETPSSETIQLFISFNLGQQKRYGINYENIEQVLERPQVTSVPGVSSVIYGVMNYKGELISIINLAELLAIEQTSTTYEAPNIIVVKYFMRNIGLLVNDTDSSETYQTADFSTRKNSAEPAYTNENFDNNIQILTPEKLLQDPKLDQLY